MNRSANPTSPGSLLLQEEEEPIRARWRQVIDTEIDMTPMIDMTFLLLIFFIVSSKLDTAAITIPQARHGGSVSEKNSVFVSLTRGENDSLAVYKGKSRAPEGRCLANDPTALEEEIVEYVSQELESSGPDKMAKEFVVLNVEVGVTEGEVERVERAVGRAIGDAASIQLHHAVLEAE